MHATAVAMYHAKTHGNSGKIVAICLQAKLGQLPCTLQKHMATASFGCGRGDGRVGEVINAHTPAPSASVKLVCGRIAKCPHTSPPCGEKGHVGDRTNAQTPAQSYVAHKNCYNAPRFVQNWLDEDPCVWASCETPTRVDVRLFVKEIQA